LTWLIVKRAGSLKPETFNTFRPGYDILDICLKLYDFSLLRRIKILNLKLWIDEG
jgi:hypothetical protein